jgi:hypothetical protein
MSISPGSDSSDTQQALGRFGLMALGLVAAGALLFMAIGMVSGDGEPVAGSTEGPTATATSTPDQATQETSVATEPAAEPTDEATDDGSGEIVNPDATASASPDDGDGDDGDGDGGDGDDGDGSEPTEDGSDGAIPNEEISVQVLDGILSDGGARAREVADDLVTAGHPLVNFGSSSRGYDETTVFYTDGQEDEGRQVAADNGWDVLRPASEVGLSDSVDVHVVVGQDEA